MKALVLGGTRFLGRHLVQALCAAGHEVTLLNRGRSDPAAFADLEQVHGDRDPRLGDALERLAGRSFDVAFDLCGYVPRVVDAACAALREQVGRYVFVSSISVYAGFPRPGLDEDAPLAPLDDPHTEDVPAHYGALKAACERQVQAAFGARALVVRPGLIVGPFDPTGRFTYWPMRMARGGTVLAPAPPQYPVQFIDARDLAQWMLQAALAGHGGAFNVTGPAAPYTLGALLAECMKACPVQAEIEWVAPEFLAQAGVKPWVDLPLWVGPDDAAMNQVSIARAVAAGLSTRPLAQTITDTLQWARAATPQHAEVGLAPERERTLLADWATRGARA